MMFRSYADLARDVRAWLQHLPPISAVAGIPRSGVIPAAIIAQERHVPLLPLELVETRTSGRPAVSRALASPPGPVLVIDDTAWRGRTIEELRPRFNSPGLIWGAVYAHPRAQRFLDVFGYHLLDPVHTFDWNLFADSIAGKLATDLDGVLAEEGRGAPVGLDARPLAPVHRQLHAIITGRPERHRGPTETWLRRLGIEFGRLYMLPNHERGGREIVAKFKASVFKRLHDRREVAAYVESCPWQARRIAGLTGLPVINYGDRRGINQTHPTPSWK